LGFFAEHFFYPHQLIVFRHSFRARKRAGLYLPGAKSNGNGYYYCNDEPQRIHGTHFREDLEDPGVEAEYLGIPVALHENDTKRCRGVFSTMVYFTHGSQVDGTLIYEDRDPNKTWKVFTSFGVDSGCVIGFGFGPTVT